LFRHLDAVGRFLADAAGWLFTPVIYCIGLLDFVSGGLAYALEVAFQAGRPVAELVPCAEPVVISAMFLIVLVRLVSLPFTLRAARHQATLAALNATVTKKLVAKHRGDREALQQDMMRLYRKHRVNPLLGCLPVLLAIPLFIAFWGLLKGLTVRSTAGTFAPQFLHSGTDLHARLNGTDELSAWGMNLLAPVTTVGFCAAIAPHLIVLGLCAILAYAQFRISVRGRTDPRMLRTGRWMVFLTLAGLVVLPSFFVILKVIDTAYMVWQTHAVKHVEKRTLQRLRHNPEFQLMAGEQVGGSAYDVHRDRGGRGDMPDVGGH
jgi:YidC/Oxa1 family membrane protein insertase